MMAPTVATSRSETNSQGIGLQVQLLPGATFQKRTHFRTAPIFSNPLSTKHIQKTHLGSFGNFHLSRPPSSCSHGASGLRSRSACFGEV